MKPRRLSSVAFDSEMIKLTNVRSSEVGQGGGDGPKDNMHGVSSLSSASANLGNNNAKETPRLTDSALGNLPEVDGFISQNPKLKLSMLLRRYLRCSGVVFCLLPSAGFGFLAHRKLSGRGSPFGC
ncbi:PREDICTED: uncharacterized protein LOC106298923 [Brassica oleracea var. oleracea]|uniref:uncharacterized protein LOC106298923 n=1 Tax=Brassica oleracea var. oleracea TaxID=109376 RepID=UPI0006A735FB|nr:PREDICTED: uncharacterized protein LOC106298923 [Brassica oleracea var. oleracea]